MNKTEIEKLVASSVARLNAFDNWHDITPENLPHCIVSPYEVMVDPDDGAGSKPRLMWVVLQEPSKAGYLVGYDPVDCAWAVLERTPEEMSPFVQVTTNGTLAEALSSM